jgi:hypothetical protein
MPDKTRSVNLEEGRRGRRRGGDATIKARLAAAPGSTGPRDTRFGRVAAIHRPRSLSPVKAAGKSAPQVCWTVTSKLECARLSEILTQFPLRGRKALEFAIWASAVVTLAQALPGRPYSERSAQRLARAAGQRHSLRLYVDSPRHVAPWARSEPGLLPYLGGFFTGEGYFGLDSRSARIAVNLRRDDRPLLSLLAAATGIGRVSDGPASGTSRPTARWTVLRHDELETAIDLLARAGLRGRKRREFDAWRVGALEFVAARSQGRRRNHDIVGRHAETLRAARRYRPPVPGSIVLGSPGPPARDVMIEVLRSWAAEYAGPLSCTAYSAFRNTHPDWPNRNTVSAAFGAWSHALDAAGLGHRAASTRQLVERRARASRASRHPRMVDRRAAQRRALLSAVRQLALNQRRSPRLQEYAQHRVQQRPDLPSIATVYRLFPNGWGSVLSSAGLRA